MRRLVTDLTAYLRAVASAARRGWNRFFFTPADPTALGLIRLAVGMLAFWSLLVLGLDLEDYFGSQGWASPAVIWQNLRERQPFAWSIWFLVPDSLLRLAWLACLAILGLFTLGLWSRVTAVLAWMIYVSTVRRVPNALFGFDQVISTLTFYLAVTGASGQAVSIDRFLRRWRDARTVARTAKVSMAGAGRPVLPTIPGAPAPTVCANLAIRLIQLHLAFIYAMAGLAKVQGPSWWNGMALWGTMTAGEFVTRDFTALAAWPLVINFLTHASLALELLYPIMVWVPLARPLLIAGALGLHTGIALVAPGLTEFGLAMIGANLAFVSGPWLRSLVSGRHQPVLRVLYDGACPRCRASMALATAADPDRVLEPVDLNDVELAAVHPSLTRDACLASMHVVTRQGRVTAGFDAVREMAGWLPLAWPMALLAWLPGVAWIGRKVYNQLAASRFRDVPCTDEVCELKPSRRPSLTGDRDRVAGAPAPVATIPAKEKKRP